MALTLSLDRRLLRLVAALTPEWLAAQRWYRGKTRRLAEVELLDAAPIDDGWSWLLVLGATDAAGELRRYLVPVTVEGDAVREPLDGEGVWRGLAALMIAGRELDGVHGRWVFAPTPAVPELLPGGIATLSGLAERRLSVQQSNSSVALGDRVILKIYRLLEPGSNPEVEVNAFLTTVGFGQAPALAGSASYLLDGEPHSAAMLQQFMPSLGDGWSWVLGRLAGPPDGQAETITGVAEIGSLTARMHTALASRPGTPGFPSRLATRDELAAWRAAGDGQLQGALAALHGPLRARLAAIVPKVSARLDAIERASSVSVSRIHGDYHLGQLLRTEGGFMVIDFEGEPARTLAERRAPASPLRDVAGMLRSLDYAAHAADLRGLGQDRLPGWLHDARTALLAGYGGIQSEDEPLLAAFELEKACYEVRYEANNRPDWIGLPLGALERLTA